MYVNTFEIGLLPQKQMSKSYNGRKMTLTVATETFTPQGDQAKGPKICLVSIYSLRQNGRG